MSKVWLITGSSRGIGRKVAEAALLAGELVVATARKPERLHDLVDQYGDRIRTVQHDVRDASAAATAVQTAVDAFDRIDMVLNAARSADPTVEDFSVDSFRVPMETNLFGFVYLIDAALPILRQQRSGHIIEISPAGSRVNYGSFSAHQISKQAVELFSVEFARDVAPLGIKVTIVETGDIPRTRSGTPVSVVVERYNESGADAAQPAPAQDNQEAEDPRREARLILSIAEMTEPPLRLLMGSEANQYVTSAGRALAGFEENLRN